MPPKLSLIAFIFFVTFAGCKSSDTTAPATNNTATSASSPATMASPATSPSADSSTSTVKSNVDVCNLLTSADLKDVQGEPLKETQRSDRQNGNFVVAQCYYALPTTSNSVVLNVTTSLDEKSGGTRRFWQETFARDEGKGKERDREKETKPKSEEDENGAAPEKVTGLGDDAYWMASRVGGALYVLKQDQFFRISVGGAGDANAKLRKSKTLAQRVLKRL